mgnify:FL=1
MTVGQIERKTQDRVIKLFQEKLDYTYLGNWEAREDNSNIEKELLTNFLKGKYSDTLIKKAISELEKVATNQNKSLYDINKEIYSMLRYGIQVKEELGENKKTVWLIDWESPTKNDFYVAEEVTVTGKHEKRPDVVLYVNGIAVVVLELKRSIVSVAEGIRQNLDNQKDIFIKNFFATNQIVMAGSDSEGLRYGVIKTPEKYFLTWKEDTGIRNRLDNHLYAMCKKEKLLELIHDFIVFDSGVKKMPRHSQYFGVKAAQEHLRRREGGIIWHSQGSGKSLMMIWLAKWIKENIDDSRVLIITDREELDEQIEGFFFGVDEKIYRTKSGRDLIKTLDETEHSLICSLIHKFGRRDQSNSDDDYFNELLSNVYKNFRAKGDLYVFVDECHRTQSGKLHEAMKKIVPNAVTVGFTGTPLLNKDKKLSLEVFGRYIHTYKWDEAVADGIILDLEYEARNIDQYMSSPRKIDQWFDAKTRGLTDYAKAVLKKRWGTLQKVRSSQSRLQRIVADVQLDMETKPRLMSGRGNALLVAGSIYEACKYYELFQERGLKKCAIVTSYDSSISSIKGETVSDDEDTDEIQKYDIYKKMLNGKDPHTFEKETKKMFVEEPQKMKLLIVVDKLLTGFDAVPATYLYIDKPMKDHALFQAVCRVNRLDGEDKDHGYIIDYKDRFGSLKTAVKDYTSGEFDGFDKEDVTGLLKDRIENAKEKLTTSLEVVRALCEPVKPPKATEDYIDFFCGSSEKPDELQNTAQRRNTLYKTSSSLIRAFANLANDMPEAGYGEKESMQMKKEVRYYENVKTTIKLASGDHIDLKAYEPAMRHLIDTYIDAEESEKISEFDNLTIVDLILKSGVDAVDKLPKSIRKNEKVVAETIENNVRRLIVEEKPTNPKYYERMSVLLDDIIKNRRDESKKYADYLKEISKLIQNVKNPSTTATYPKSVNSRAKIALYDNLDNNEEAALKCDDAIIKNKPDGWRGNKIKEKTVKIAIKKALKPFGFDEAKIEEIFKIAKEQDEY